MFRRTPPREEVGGQRFLLRERHRAGHPGVAEVSPARAVHRHRRASRRRSRGGVLHHRPSDDSVLPQVRRVLPRHRRPQGEFWL